MMYSVLLILAIAVVLLGGAAQGLSFVERVAFDRVRMWARAGRACGLIAVALALSAGVAHFALGHGGGSEAPMALTTFLREHPVVIFLLLSGIGLAMIRRGAHTS